MGLFACFGGKKKGGADGEDVKAPGADGRANEAGAASVGGGSGLNAAQSSGQIAQNHGGTGAAEHSSGRVAKKHSGRHDPGPGRTPPAERSNVGGGEYAEGAMASRFKNAADENVGNTRAGADPGAAAMTEAQKREAEYAAMEEEQQRRLVARVTKWVDDANQHASEMMSLSVDLESLRNIEENSNPDTSANAQGGAIDSTRREKTLGSSSVDMRESRQMQNEQDEVGMQA
uniref:Uncharacterized protein n=1 Tax=Erythrolobus australicus TaxID=1077150 RepID=A0A7S1TMP0_9RHOD|mmetsp:Transcript_3642/g.10137  ORF Transcript_3642/g.10137 Transcript_3642/m.10137 type:complete len:231 (+) Transcript_3642:189-881(+)